MSSEWLGQVYVSRSLVIGHWVKARVTGGHTSVNKYTHLQTVHLWLKGNVVWVSFSHNLCYVTSSKFRLKVRHQNQKIRRRRSVQILVGQFCHVTDTDEEIIWQPHQSICHDTLAVMIVEKMRVIVVKQTADLCRWASKWDIHYKTAQTLTDEWEWKMKCAAKYVKIHIFHDKICIIDM